MSHLEGVLTLVSGSGPWFRIQGRHVRDTSSNWFGSRLALSPTSGITADLHFGQALWVRVGWYPAHIGCPTPVVGDSSAWRHQCWSRFLPLRVLQRGLA